MELPVDVRELMLAAFRQAGAFIIRNPAAQVVTITLDLETAEAIVQGSLPVRLDNYPA